MSSSAINSQSAVPQSRLQNSDEIPELVPAFSAGTKKPVQAAVEERIQSKEQVASASPRASSVGDEQVRQLAYQLYEERGREDGHAMEDWIEAEARLRRAS